MRSLSGGEDVRSVIEGLLSGDAALYRAIKLRIAQYLFRHTLPAHTDREELADEILLIFFEDLKDGHFRGDNVRTLNAYLYAIVRNQIRKRFRKQRLLFTDNLDQAPDPRTEDPGQRIEQKQLIDKLFDALDDNCVQLIRMKFQLGWTDQEIADHLGKTKNAVSTAISRCLQKARELSFMQDHG